MCCWSMVGGVFEFVFVMHAKIVPSTTAGYSGSFLHRVGDAAAAEEDDSEAGAVQLRHKLPR